MKLTKEDFPSLAWPLACFLGSVAFAVAAPMAAQKFLQKMVVEESGAEKALSVAGNRIREAKRDRDNLSSYQAAYRGLVKRGMVGDFQRLDLIEQLEKIGSSLFDMQYSISPRQKIPVSDSFELNVNRAVFQLSLLHEGRLLDFFDVLEAQTRGLPLIEGCGIERIGTSTGYEAHLKAVCTVSWVTLESLK
ncbi:MAG: hypothetical protein K2P57_06965 [Burkholderiales bacterium]|nr:hypothetical protein [Burkholderiales bacterium]